MLLAAPFLLLALGLIILAAQLFTNAVEWLGFRLGLAEGAVGSVLAAIGTALPETMIPVIAILVVGTESSSEIGIGAIVGAPFLLSTAAFAVTGCGVLCFRKQRRNGTAMRLDAAVVRRDLGYFCVFYLAAIGASFVDGRLVHYGFALLLLGLYGVYVYRVFSAAGRAVAASSEELSPLHLHRYTGGVGLPSITLICSQFLAALGLMIAGAQIFVINLETVSHSLDVPALVLALVIAPLATELPETFNSIIWVRQEKDTLAMGNISGAMVLQSCLPASLGIAFTSWDLTEAALVSATIAFASTGLVYFSLLRLGYLSAFVLAHAGLLWVGFVGYVLIRLSGA